MFKVASVLSCLAVIAATRHHNFYEGPYHHNELRNTLFHKQDYERLVVKQPNYNQKIITPAVVAHNEIPYTNRRLTSGLHQKVYLKAHNILVSQEPIKYKTSIEPHYMPYHQSWDVPQIFQIEQHEDFYPDHQVEKISSKFEVPTDEVFVYSEGIKQSHSEEKYNDKINHAFKKKPTAPKEIPIYEESQEGQNEWAEYLKSQKTQKKESNIKVQVPDIEHDKQEVHNAHGWEEFLKSQKSQNTAIDHKQLEAHNEWEEYLKRQKSQVLTTTELKKPEVHNEWEEHLKKQKTQDYEKNIKPQITILEHEKQEAHNGWEEYLKKQKTQKTELKKSEAHNEWEEHLKSQKTHKHGKNIIVEVQNVEHKTPKAHNGWEEYLKKQKTEISSKGHNGPIVLLEAFANHPVQEYFENVHKESYNLHHEQDNASTNHAQTNFHVTAVSTKAHVESPSPFRHAHKQVIDYYTHPEYNFEYGVNDPHTKDHKSQWEQRNGHVVKGAYTFDEADGTKRVVEYTANKKTGFNAVVQKTGYAFHPQSYGKPEPKTFHKLHDENHEIQEEKHEQS